jgi:hypothetical protein
MPDLWIPAFAGTTVRAIALLCALRVSVVKLSWETNA